MAEALADRLAEAFAECLHKRVRRRVGLRPRRRSLTNEEPLDDLIQRSIAASARRPGYPACPDHTEKGTLWRLLDVERRPA